MSHALIYAVYLLLSLFGLGFFIWFFWRAVKNSEDPAKLVFRWLLTAAAVWIEVAVAMPAYGAGGLSAIFGLGLTMGLALFINIIWRHSLLDMITKPLTSLFDGGNEPPEKKPYYSVTKAKRNRGHYYEAVAEVRQQLDKFPNDFEGVLLLAGIQAENMKDLPAAENTLNHFCERPEAPMRLVAAALTQLADWHIKLSADVDSARAALQKIVTRFPGTEPALHAEQRMAHLGETEKIILAQHDRQSIAVPEGVQNIGLLDSTEFLKPQEIDPGKLAAAHVQHLETHPHDAEVREKLAVLYAKDFKRLDLATMELAQLINEPKHKPKQVAHWLNLLANFQVELGADVATVKATLEKIVENFPDLSVAEIAQRRLARLNSEFKGQQQTSSVKLGVYEQNIGLKYGSSRKM